MKTTIEKIFSARILALMVAVCATGGAWADFTMTNPVTGEDETYDNKFTGGSDGTGTEWNNSSNWDPSVTPFVSGDYNASLVSNKTVSTSTAIDGYTLRVGAYNGAAVTWSGGITKIQAGTAGCWLTADATSSITLAFNGNSKQLEGSSTYPLKLSSAKAGGITWTSGLANAGNTSLPFWYYLKGAGTVVYGGDITVANAQVIKMADVTLSGNAKSVQSKTLVSFGSGTTKTFTADAAIKVYGTDGTTLATTVNLATVNTTGSTTLTTSDPVGTVELVQTSTGVVLYYVDGDPADVNVGEKTYKPSISVNFTSGTALSTAGDVGLAGYAVPGPSWNNLTVANNATLSPLNKIDSTGAATASSASVTITNTRGEWHCSSLVATSDMRAGYIDETADVTTPTVTVSGIPYDQYKVVVYTATDAANVKFGYVTINGTNYTYSDGAVAEGATAWGASGAQNTAEALAEGVNVLVSPVVSGGTLTVVGHRSGNNPRGCIAAVQIVKVEQQVGENDLLIELDGDRTYTFDEAKNYSGTVYVTGSGTLTFAGAASTAATLHIGPVASVNIVGSALTPTTVTGNGTVVYDGAQPSTTLGFDNSANWQGTVWVKNVGSGGETSKTTATLGSDTSTAANNTINNWGNANSRVKFTNVRGHVSACNCAWTLVLEDDGDTKAWYNNNGWTGSSKDPVFAKLAGDGTFYDTYNDGCRQNVTFTDASEFTGTFNVGAKRIGIGGTNTADNNQNYRGTIEIVSGAVATIASGKTWTSATGFRVNGTLNVDGTLSCSASTAVSGSGTVVFTGRVPTPTGNTWWKNAAWTGTVWIKSHAIVELDTNLYGNEGSTLKFTGVTGYFAQSHVNTVPIELENSGSTVAFNYNNGWGGELLTFSELKGTGTLQTSSAGNGGTIWVKKWDTFTGVMNLGHKQVVMGGDEPDHSNVNRNGKLVIAEGAVVTNLNATTSWTAGGGIEVNGTFAASDRTAWADGTAMTVNSTGILNMYGSGVNDTSKSFANVTGTGTIWYSQTTTANDKWSALPSSAVNMFANTLSVSNDNVNAGVIITMNGASDVVTTNANISGTGYFRSDWGTGANRGFLALQSKNTTWSGTFGSDSRIKKFIVAGVDGATDRTLTLAGTQSSTIPLTVESLGSVNITGTYLGATTVAGTFGGTGTLKGNLTFSDGATFKANTSALTISGSNTVTFPSEGSVTVDLTSIELSSSGTTLISGASSIANSANLTASGAYFAVEGDGTKSLVAYAHVATYSGVKYATFADAIAAALADEGGEANLALITVVDGSAELPAGYHISDNTVVKYPVAVVKNGSYLATGYTDTIFQAIQAIYSVDPIAGAYDYIEIVSGSSFEIPYGLLGDGVLKIKNTANATPILDGLADDCEVDTNEPEGEVYTEYSKVNKPTVYTWTGAAAGHLWSAKGNWSYVNNSSETVTASRAPAAGDSVVFTSAVSDLTIGADTSVVSVSIGAGVIISTEYLDDIALNTTEGGIVLTDAAATLTVTGVTLSQDPTSGVDLMYVKATNSDGTTTYSLQAAGEMDGTTAIITDTTETIIIPDSATAVKLYPSTSSFTFVGTAAQITAGGLYAKYTINDVVYEQDITEAFNATLTPEEGGKYSDALVFAGQFLSGGDKTVLVGSEDIKVIPQVAASSPMTLDDTVGGDTEASFNIKTIPGLYYAVQTGAFNGSGVWEPSGYGDAVQATSDSTSVTAPEFEGTVQYYKIAVGLAADDVSPTP